MSKTYVKDILVDYRELHELNERLKAEGNCSQTKVLAKFSVAFDDDYEAVFEVTEFSSGCTQVHGYLYDCDGTLVEETDPYYELDGTWNFGANGDTYSVCIKPKVITNEPDTMFIVRGCPGSGKTTFVNTFLNGVFHIENDMFHMNGTEYAWSADNMDKSIDFCLNAARFAMDNGVSLAVSNTFTKRRYVTSYVSNAELKGFKVIVFRMMGDFKNIHNVPTETLKNMKEHFDDYPNEILVYPKEGGYRFVSPCFGNNSIEVGNK